MSNIHPIFEEILSGFVRKPAARAELEYTPCDSCGAPSTHAVYDPGDASTGYGDSFVEMCDECDAA